jgi:hypothetical protein
MNIEKYTLDKIKQKLSRTTGNNHYNNWHNRTTYGYHSFDIGNLKLTGQRQPKLRLEYMKEHVSFENKTIMDFGCNTGGMIFHSPELKCALGVDFNDECIDACKYISYVLKYKTDHYFDVCDLNNFDLNSYLVSKNIEKIDIALLLSLGSWVSEWKKLYDACINACEVIILETNNDNEGKPQLEFFESRGCTVKLINEKSTDDTTGNYGRKTFIIKPIHI